MIKDNSSSQPSIYLFTNHGFGLPLTALLLSHLRDKAKLTLVYSREVHHDHMSSSARLRLNQFRYGLIKLWISLIARLNTARIEEVVDVNSPKFLSTIRTQ